MIPLISFQPSWIGQEHLTFSEMNTLKNIAQELGLDDVYKLIDQCVRSDVNVSEIYDKLPHYMQKEFQSILEYRYGHLSDYERERELTGTWPQNNDHLRLRSLRQSADRKASVYQGPVFYRGTDDELVYAMRIAQTERLPAPEKEAKIRSEILAAQKRIIAGDVPSQVLSDLIRQTENQAGKPSTLPRPRHADVDTQK